MLDTPDTAAPVLYVLDGHKPVVEPDLAKWAAFMYAGELRKVAQTRSKNGKVLIATVFLGVSYEHPPRLFETMVFRGRVTIATYHYGTWAEAERGHKSCLTLYNE